MAKDNFLLDLAIEDEVTGISYFKNSYDKQLLKQLFFEINNQNGTNYRYVAQLDFLKIDNINHIIMKYIDEFNSEHIRVILVKQLFLGDDFEKEDLAIKYYNKFKESKEYISEIGEPSPRKIVTIYDNLFSSFCSKKEKVKLLEIIKNPRDAYYLPLTMKMLTLLKTEEIKNILLKFLNSSFITRKIGSIYKDEGYDPSLSIIKYELTIMSIDGLKYYHTEEVCNIIAKYENDKNHEIQKHAIKTLSYLKKGIE